MTQPGMSQSKWAFNFINLYLKVVFIMFLQHSSISYDNCVKCRRTLSRRLTTVTNKSHVFW